MPSLNEVTFTLNPIPPFDFAQSLAFIGEFPPSFGEQKLASHTLTKAIRVSGQTVVFAVQSVGTIDAPQLSVRLYSAEPLSTEQFEQAEDRVGFYLSINDDVRPLYALAESDAPFRALLQKAYGYHQVKFLTPFENAVWSILTQRNPMSVARTMKKQLTERYGGKLTVNDTVYEAFPSAQDFGDASALDLQALIGNDRKASYVYATVQAFQQVDEAWLRTAPYEAVEKWLLSIKGIGAWSTSFVMLRGLGRMEKTVITADDNSFNSEMLKAATKVYGVLTLPQLKHIADHYGEHQGYWAHYVRGQA